MQRPTRAGSDVPGDTFKPFRYPKVLFHMHARTVSALEGPCKTSRPHALVRPLRRNLAECQPLVHFIIDGIGKTSVAVKSGGGRSCRSRSRPCAILEMVTRGLGLGGERRQSRL